MDEIREDKLKHYQCIENMIKDFEENEAKTNKAIRLKLESNPPIRIGPAYELLQYLYILEQQSQNDSDEIRRKTEESVLEYLDQFRSTVDDVAETDDNDQSSDEPQQQPIPILPINPQPPTTTTQSLVAVPSPTQPPIVTASAAQPSSLVPVIDSKHITRNTFVRYQKLLSEAEQYERRYKTVDSERKEHLTSCIKSTMNKLRKETLQILTNELFAFLNGQEQKVGSSSVRISNEEERLLCLSILATLTFNQLLGGDLDNTKADIFVPLIATVSANEQQKEFSTIFLDRLHKICPYTIPYYPKREPTMTDKQYYEAMGYIKIKEGSQVRLQTETEFLLRMSGLIRFFCKLLVRRGPPFDNRLDYAWTWFSDILNLPPRPNITAVIARIFLDEAGESMIKEYSGQFIKILLAIETKYLPEFKKETSNDQIIRLQNTLDTLMKKNPNVLS